MTTTNQIIATPDFDGNTCGAITYWRLDGAVTHDALTAAWVAQGLDEAALPEQPSPEVCLKRAVHAQATARGGYRRIIRPLAKRGAWAVLDETVNDAQDDVVHTHVCRVRFDASRGARPWTVEAIDGAYSEVRAIGHAIEAAYDAARQELSVDDISAWLVRRAEAVRAVSLRDTGGLYFVPQPAVADWHKAAAALAACSGHALYRIPALRSSEAAEAVLDAVTAEAEAESAKIEADLQAEGDDALGARALQGRADRASAIFAKVQSYEALLGAKLDALRAKLEALQGNVAGAILVAQAAEAAEEEAAHAA